MPLTIASKASLINPMPSAASLFQIDPTQDPRWRELVARHPLATVFHTPEWLVALRQTYGYQPVALTTSHPDEELTNGLVYCHVKSWLTGCRLVSLPFSDHCDPLLKTPEEWGCFSDALKQEIAVRRWQYVEVRPRAALPGGPAAPQDGTGYCFHYLDLRPDLNNLFSRFHKTGVQQMIRRAERENLVYEEGSSERQLGQFYALLVETRRRQHLPPQPIEWFRTLIRSMGQQIKIRVVLRGNDPVASILTLRSKETMVYKYGCSNKAFSNLGGTQLLIWKAIQEAKADGLTGLDLGRSDRGNSGLIEFKDRWGAERSVIHYIRYARLPRKESASAWKMNSVGKKLWANIPDGVLTMAGRMLYRHIA
jgi:CelD/BcsL family acetyltransferase involved in cellulose biosynthesis